MKKKHTPLTNDEVRVIKISEAALYEFIYEKFIDDQDTYLDVDNLSVTDFFILIGKIDSLFFVRTKQKMKMVNY